MTTNLKQALQSVKYLTAHERAIVARYLISSLEEEQYDDVDFEWAELAEKRYQELISGAVKTKSWAEIRREVK